MAWDNVASTVAGGLVTALVAYLTLRGTLRNQLSLEQRKFEYQQRLDQEARDHEASAFRRTVLRQLRRLHNTARMSPKTRMSVKSWKRSTEELRALLESAECAKSLDDERFEQVWRACEESEAAILFLQAWADHSNDHTAKVALLSLREYYVALEGCFNAFGDADNAFDVRAPIDRNF